MHRGNLGFAFNPTHPTLVFEMNDNQSVNKRLAEILRWQRGPNNELSEGELDLLAALPWGRPCVALVCTLPVRRGTERRVLVR